MRHDDETGLVVSWLITVKLKVATWNALGVTKDTLVRGWISGVEEVELPQARLGGFIIRRVRMGELGRPGVRFDANPAISTQQSVRDRRVYLA